jgi:hypothetical protein
MRVGVLCSDVGSVIYRQCSKKGRTMKQVVK